MIMQIKSIPLEETVSFWNVLGTSLLFLPSLYLSPIVPLLEYLVQAPGFQQLSSLVPVTLDPFLYFRN